jgi:hypothetical protein
MSKQAFINKMKEFGLVVKRIQDEPGYIMVYMLIDGTEVADMKCFVDVEDNMIVLDLGRTYTGFNRKGYGRKLRAQITMAAFDADFERVEQTSTNINKILSPKSRPISAKIMNNLGFKIDRKYNTGDENRSLSRTNNRSSLVRYI